MTRVEIIPATEAHARDLAPRVRQVDADEIHAAGNWTPLGALLAGVDLSRPARAALFDGEVGCMYGVTPLRTSFTSGRTGAAWLIASSIVERHAKAFWRECRPEIVRLFESYDLLVNAIDLRHEQALRWAARLGFVLEDPAASGYEQRPFSTFRARKEDLTCARPR